MQNSQPIEAENATGTATDKLVKPHTETPEVPATPEAWPPPPYQQRNLELDQIQGNSIGGFNKDTQAMLFFRFSAVDKAVWALGGAVSAARPEPVGIIADVIASSSEQVLRFNAQFKALRSEGVPEGAISRTWTNLVVTPAGMRQLGVSEEEINLFPTAFRDGMKRRYANLGDNGQSDPKFWDDIVEWDTVHALLIVASDDPTEIDPTNSAGRVGRYLALIADVGSGLEMAGQGQIYGATRADQPGHEHFGFKDGVSQPGIRGINASDDPIGNPDQGHPGQDLLHPGEFILGYPRQQPTAKDHHDGPNPDPGIISGSGKIYEPQNAAIDPEGERLPLPQWADNGSFLVFRRLEQDVFGFQHFVEKKAQELKVTPDLLGAKLVGRYRSGAPLEKRKFQKGDDSFEPPLHDPGVAHPELADSDTLNNNFEFGDDKEGHIVPLAAHIRKSYPRDQVPTHEFGKPEDSPGKNAESRTQTHRLLRRGIPYGPSLGMNSGGSPYEKRGLLFLAYQTDIERQFEFVQRYWVNDADFPQSGAGQDPIITPLTDGDDAPMQVCPYSSQAAIAAKQCPVTVGIQHFIATRGGGYFFSPSIDTLKSWLKAGQE